LIPFGNFLRFPEERILKELVLLLLRNTYDSIIAAYIVATLMLVVLINNDNSLNMKVWCASVMLSNLLAFLHARRHLASGTYRDHAKRLATELTFLNAVDGAVWGSLAWAALGAATGNAAILVFAVSAGAAGAAASQISPVLPVFVVFVCMELSAVLTRVWTLHDPYYGALGFASIVYVIYLCGQARNNSKTIQRSIELRFENTELLIQLRVEKAIAETAQREAEHANTAKSKFLAAASHDLRQPIHAQGLFLEVLSRTALTEHQQALLANTRAASEASGELLNALLDFSRIEAGVISPQLQHVQLQPLLNKIETELAPQADAKNIVYRSRETRLMVQTDPMLLELILRNLVSNAIRYTEHGGVLVACRQHGNQALLEVWDTGIGIAPEHRKEIFREFHQLGNPERDRHKGLGLGLAIADGLARTLGHDLVLASTPQRGSVFRITLPIVTSIPATQNSLTKTRTRLLYARLLVVDDDETVREGMLHLLRDWGCECEAAESIEDALALARLHRPDIVICDYRLREQRTGVEAIAALRALLGESLPALLITGDTAPERLREAQASGIPLLHKPVSPGKLYRKLVELQQNQA
jgi:two-component system, sensor histidine kinase